MPLVYAVVAVLVFAAGAIVLAAGLAVLLVSAALAVAVGLAVTAVCTTWFVVAGICRALVCVLRDDEHEYLRVAPPDPIPPGRDPAYLGYYFGPAFRDYALATSRGAVAARDRTLVRSTPEVRSVLDVLLLVWHLPDELDMLPSVLCKIIVGGAVLGGLAGLVVGGLAAAVFLAITSATFGLLLGVLVGGLLVVCGVLRLVELGLLRLRGITIECPSCHRRMGMPIYECPGCQELHRRLVPGSLGVLKRTCRCGHELPTLVRGRSQLRAHCGHESCRGVLPLGSLTVPTRHVPVVAGKAAGKTVHTMAAIADLKACAGKSGFQFGDAHTDTTYQEVESALRDVAAVPATLPTAPLRASTFFLGFNGGRRLVYLYDAAGERYQTGERVSGMRFLGVTAGVLLVVDPFALATVRDQMMANDVALPPHSTDPPGDVIGRFTEGLREQRVARDGSRIAVPAAVVLTKCDVLVDGPVRHPFDGVHVAHGEREGSLTARSDAVALWLDADAGQGGLVRQLRNDYAHLAFFAVSALDAFGTVDRPTARTGQPVRNDEPSAPLRWLLATSKGPA
jgi:double-GTPase-like protein